MFEWVQDYAFPLILAYGAVTSTLFGLLDPLRRSLLAVYLYLLGFGLLLVCLGSHNIGNYGIGGLFLTLLESPLVLVCNAVPLYLSMERLVTGTVRSVMGYDQMVFRKTYDRASGAEARGEWELAESLYRDELQDSPDDLEARRRLAEVLIRRSRADEAVRELEHVMESAEQKEMRYSTAFRLAEVLDDELGDQATAENLYRLIVQEDPRSKYARYARSRLGGGDSGEAPTD
jgi:tetratricopeptide (TPR) repeat protein